MEDVNERGKISLPYSLYETYAFVNLQKILCSCHPYRMVLGWLTLGKIVSFFNPPFIPERVRNTFSIRNL